MTGLPAFPLKGPLLTPKRIYTAIIIAAVADGLQIALGPVGAVGASQVIDVVAAIITMSLLGFHPLLLPTFLLELIPIADMLPTWLGCVLVVVSLRKRAQEVTAPPKIVVHPPDPPPADGFRG